MTDVRETFQDALGDRYQLEGELGSGGQGTVFRARDLRLGRTVAVKFLRPDLAPLVGPDRFQREIAIAAQLTHPNILPLLDSGGEGRFLYYTMPLLEGESLRVRLRREPQLPFGDALAIVRDVAAALDYAHARGIVHRDIKPENVVLTGERAVVLDFGIARAIEVAGEERITSSSVAVGTPAYMSPEQASASSHVDGRADIYALGCVLYEMLGGTPPFTGATPQAVFARHRLEPPPRLAVIRDTVTPPLEEALGKALAKAPADRYRTGAEFVAALEAALTGQWTPPAPPHRRRRLLRVGLGVAAAVLALAGVWALAGRRGAASAETARADTTTLVVLPPDGGPVEALPFDAGQLLRDAFGRWAGITVADAAPVADAVRREDGTASPRSATRVALALGAGRYVRWEVSPVGDSLRVHAALFDLGGQGRQLADTTVRIAREVRGADLAFAVLARRLLVRRPPSALLAGADATTRSLPALQAFGRGIAAVERWDLAAADSALAAATERDPAFPEAQLWLAVTRWWSGAPLAVWRGPAERAAAMGRLGPRDAALAADLAALAAGEVARACDALGRLARRWPQDFTSWYAWATCLRRDSLVVRDAASPSGWRFRSSYHQALVAYQRAFVLLPSTHRSLRRDESMREVLLTSALQQVSGRAPPPGNGRFLAHPSWLGDTLAFVPWPERDFVEGRAWTVPATRDLAVRRQQEIFRDVASAWAVSYPRSPDALEALSLSLELLADPASVDTLRRARQLTSDPADAVRLAAHEVWLRLKFAVPNGQAELAAAHALADSLLRRHPPGAAPQPGLLAGLAALEGRAGLAAAYAARPAAAATLGVPSVVAGDAGPLLVFAALGGPADSLRVHEDAVLRIMAADSLSAIRVRARSDWLARAASLAFPRQSLRSLAALADVGDYLVGAEIAYARGDTAAMRAVLRRVAAARTRTRPADLTVDALYPEAWLLAASGDPAAAVAWLDPTLAALRFSPPGALADPVRAGALVQAMALRVEAGAQLGDTAAARPWARAVVELWRDADPFLRPAVERSRAIAR